MKKIILLLTVAFVAIMAMPQAAAQSFYDRTGSYIGKIESNGSVYDRTGSYQGKIDSNGSVYDRTGSYKGKVNSDGSLYDRTGSYLGKAQGVSARHAAAVMFFFFR